MKYTSLTQREMKAIEMEYSLYASHGLYGGMSSIEYVLEVIQEQDLVDYLVITYRAQ